MHNPRVLIVVSVAAMSAMIGVGMVVARLPQRVGDLSGSFDNVGFLASAFAVSYLLVQWPVGRLADRFGAKAFLVVGYALCGCSGLVFAFASSTTQIYLGRFVQGAGEAPLWALGPALLSLVYPQARGRVIGIYNAAIHAGLTAGPLVGFLLAPAGDGRLFFVAFSIFCCAAAVLTVLFVPAPASHVEHRGARRSGPCDLVRILRLPTPALTLSRAPLSSVRSTALA